jgi:dephospho-CoA kinase
MPLTIFALTGGIGSGKSSVAARLRARGVPVINADELAREVVAPGTDGLRRVFEAFGTGVQRSDGSLDRSKLGAIVFADPAARKRLEAITHPLVRKLSDERFQTLERAGEPLACYEVPLLYEAGLESRFETVVVVSATAATQLTRVQARDGLGREQAQSRIDAQLPLEQKANRASFVIDNDGTLEAAMKDTDRVLDAICHTHGIPAGRYPTPRTGT